MVIRRRLLLGDILRERERSQTWATAYTFLDESGGITTLSYGDLGRRPRLPLRGHRRGPHPADDLRARPSTFAGRRAGRPSDFRIDYYAAARQISVPCQPAAGARRAHLA